ncbi:hypothetical protein TURU_107767 [Turdus rufiventris]|nr:hypothetical protein TURU_107767 [Turdus rufiventris]
MAAWGSREPRDWKRPVELSYNRSPPISLALSCHVRIFLKYLQEWSLHRLPGKPVPMSNHRSCEEIPTNVQPKLALVQLGPFR